MFPGIPGEWRVLDLSGFERKGGAAGGGVQAIIYGKKDAGKRQNCVNYLK